MKNKKIYRIAAIAALVVLLGFVSFHVYTGHQARVEAVSEQRAKKAQAKRVKQAKKVAATPKTVTDDKDMVGLKKFDYRDPSEKKGYPNLMAHPNAWVDVDIATQRVYIKDGDKKLYEMYSSTGKDDTTPRGTYYIQNERGNFFYTQPLKMGAYYYVSFLNHGEYLFHTTPTDLYGKYDKKIAKTLGREPSSHGCIHLSVADCKWFYDNAPEKMKVVIHGKYKETAKEA